MMNAGADELFVSIFRSFEAGIANIISSLKWQEITYINFILTKGIIHLNEVGLRCCLIYSSCVFV